MKKGSISAASLLMALLVMLVAGCGSSVSEKYPLTSATANLEPASTQYSNPTLLVSADSVEASLGARDLIIIDARSAAAYAAGHIPRAINVRYGDYFTPSTGLKDTATLETQLGAAGIQRTSKILIYDDTTASWGAAGRIFWMLEYLGCGDVHLLDGGWDKWAVDGRPTETTSRTLTQATFTAQVQESRKISASRISHRLFDNDFAVIDARTDEEYNGWQLYGEARGGHIPNAVNIPYASFYNSDKTTVSYLALKELLESRGITPDKEVTSYCTAGIRSGYVYFLLRLMGYARCSNYDASMFDWSAQSELPMEKAANFKDLVYPAWVKKLIDYHKPGSTSVAPPEYPYDRNHKYLIFETQWGDLTYADAYKAGHIPGAVHSDSDTYENGYPRWFLLPDDELKAAAGRMGITADTTVVVYSDSAIFAARLWWILKYLGVQDVRMLNGGYSGWLASGYAGETAVNMPIPAVYSGTVNPAVIASVPYTASVYNTPSTWLADVRSGSEYAGIISGYSYLDAKGRIPGAIWAYDGDDASPAYRDSDGTLRSYTEVRSMWRQLGITSTVNPNLFDREVIFYCGGGYRSSLTYFYAHLMGYSNIRNLSDGWAGWSTSYTEDPTWTGGSTPGWRQDPSGRPFATGWP
ncbi:MAG: sulfurtransferase [Rhodocyclaceae bacterium]|nr:sulfurtransferase [Rhodocyclaceae bacterium]